MSNKFSKFANLVVTLLLSAVLVVSLNYAMQHAAATSQDENYAIILDGLSAPNYGREAPYGQWIVTHNTVAGITTTVVNYGTVARTNGYDPIKSVICYNSGAYDAELTIAIRTTSTGTPYIVYDDWNVVSAGARSVFTYTDIAPWTSLGITSTNAVTGTTMLCGIYVQTP